MFGLQKESSPWKPDTTNNGDAQVIKCRNAILSVKSLPQID